MLSVDTVSMSNGTQPIAGSMQYTKSMNKLPEKKRSVEWNRQEGGMEKDCCKWRTYIYLTLNLCSTYEYGIRT